MGCASSSSTDIHQSHTKFIVAKDYTEIEGRIAGEGVKQTKAWEATLTPSILQQKRSEFWLTFRGHSHSSCLLLKQACEADAASAKLMLDMEGFILENGTMSVCISPRGHRYELPPFILADPVKFKDGTVQNIVKKVIKEGIISVKLRSVFIAKEEEVSVSNLIAVKEVKRQYLEKNKEFKDVRMFFGGKELADDKTLISYSIESGMVIQVYKKSIPE